jgi:hypothetical protein
VTRADPSPAVFWLIEVLAERGVKVDPSKIERLQHDGLAPRPLYHRHPRLHGADLWSQGAVGHYEAVAPLVRQRHNSKELAALTMLGWGYPIDIGLLRRAYAKTYALDDRIDRRVELLVDHYENKGMPVLKSAIAHVRSHGVVAPEDTARDVAHDLIESTLTFASGQAGSDQIRRVLGASLPKYGQAPEQLLEWVITLFGVLQREIALPMLLKTVNESSTEDLLRHQPEAQTEIERNLEYLGGFDAGCQSCAETRGILTAAAIPISVRLERVDFDSMIESLPEPPNVAM